MILDILILIILYYIHKYIVSWIVYYNNTDKRYGNSVWRWTYDYPVEGKEIFQILMTKFLLEKEE